MKNEKAHTAHTSQKIGGAPLRHGLSSQALALCLVWGRGFIYAVHVCTVHIHKSEREMVLESLHEIPPHRSHRPRYGRL